MSNPLILLEQYNRLTPLGLRFWDSVSGGFVGSGLEVTAYPAANPRKKVMAVPTRSGVYLLQNLPGLRQTEMGAGDTAFWARSAPKPFVIEVRDLDGPGVLPFQLALSLPVKGIFEWSVWPVASPLASPLEALPVGIPLFSAPARSVPAGMAVIYTELWDPKAEQPGQPPGTPSGRPATGALLEARSAGRAPAWGMADEWGRVTLIMAYPEPLAFEPPAANRSGRALTEQIWPLELRAYYERPEPATPDGLPDLNRIMQQPEATLWANTALTTALTGPDLRYGQALQVRTHDDEKGKLLITPAAG